MTRGRERGFTLLEVIVALGILAVSLGVFLEAQATSLAGAARTRGMTFAALLARSKMVDIEQRLFDEGFTLGDIEEEGDFADEGQPQFKWSYKVMEVELDLTGMAALGGGGEQDEDGAGGGGDLSGMLSGFGGSLEGFAKQTGESIRVVDLTVSWPEGNGTEKLRVRSVVTRDDLGIANRGGGTDQVPVPAGGGTGQMPVTPGGRDQR